MKLETSKPNAPTGVALQRLVRRIHPWKQSFEAKAKIEAARRQKYFNGRKVYRQPKSESEKIAIGIKGYA